MKGFCFSRTVNGAAWGRCLCFFDGDKMNSVLETLVPFTRTEDVCLNHLVETNFKRKKKEVPFPKEDSAQNFPS